MKLKCVKTWNYKYAGLTDREKRQIMDLEIQKNYPNDSPEQIRELRETYLRDNNAANSLYLPKQDTKSDPREILTMENVVREIYTEKGSARKIEKTGNDELFMFILFSIAMLMIAVPSVRTIIVFAFLAFFAYLGLFSVYNRLRKKIHQNEGTAAILRMLTQKNCAVECFTVVDLIKEIRSGSDDDTVYWNMLVCKPNSQEVEKYEINHNQYLQIWEGDMVYILRLNLSGVPGVSFSESTYLICTGNWKLDDQLMQLLETQ